MSKVKICIFPAFHNNIRVSFCRISTRNSEVLSKRVGSSSVSVKPRLSTFVQLFRNYLLGFSLFHVLVESSRLTVESYCNELINVQPSRIVHSCLRSPNNHIEGELNTKVRPRAFTCKEHPIECPRYASASTFVIGLLLLLVFGWSRAFCAHRLYG